MTEAPPTGSTGGGASGLGGNDRVVDDAAAWRGIYVHIPFCHRVCPYCDFAVVAGAEDQIDRYVAAVIREIESTQPLDGRLDAVYIGGGTPSSIDPASLGSIVATVDDRFGLADDAEISLETNPEDWSVAFSDGLMLAGFNRVSLGAQSFDPGVLAALGRRHAPDDAAAGVAHARRAGIRSINIDLMFGTPGETITSWHNSVGRALDTGVDHVSMYALTVETGTPLSREVSAGAAAPDSDDQADKWEAGAALAEASGLTRYETSNFALRGHECRYNLLTWAQGSYLAAGNGAHRHVAGERSWNIRRLDRYLEAIEHGGSAVSGSERLDAWGVEQERVVLGLRRAAGVVPAAGGSALWASAEGRRLRDAGVIDLVGDRLIVTRPLLGDQVARTVLGLQPVES